MTPVTLFGLEKEVKKEELYYEELNKEIEPFINHEEYVSFPDSLYTQSFECLYDRGFDVKTYNKLCSYNFNFFIINVDQKDLEKAIPFIEADKDKEDVLIVNIENTMFPHK